MRTYPVCSRRSNLMGYIGIVLILATLLLAGLPVAAADRLTALPASAGVSSPSQLWALVTKLVPGDGALYDEFGNAVSLHADTLAVGAWHYDSYRGAAYIFYRDQGGADAWGQVAKLTASDGAASDAFGYTISINGDTLAVGTPMDDTSAGAVYIFYRNQGGPDAWGQVKKIIPTDAAANDLFGIAVSLHADTLVVGADGYSSDTGAAYVFSRNQGGTDNWGQVKKLTASDGVAGDAFGGAVVVHYDTLVVTAGKDNAAPGVAYVFYRNQGGAENWGQVKEISASDGAAGDSFGYNVSLNGGTLVLGAHGDDDMGSGSGSIYLFYRDQGGTDNWGQLVKIVAADGNIDDHFGLSVSVNRDTLVVGATGDDDAGSSSGSAYIFARNYGGADAWGQVQKLTASDGAANDLFGNAVSVEGYALAVGAYWDDDKGDSSGSAYVYKTDAPPPPPNLKVYLPAVYK